MKFVVGLRCLWIVTIGLLGAGLFQARAQSILREYWNGISGTTIANLTGSPDYPLNPSGTSYPSLFEAPVSFGDNYGTRMRGYVIPPVTGDYTFWIATDDNGHLYLSTNEMPQYVQLVARVDSWAGSQVYDKFPSQQSTPIRLEAGQRYYIEALQKEGGGGDNLSVGWQLPDGSLDRPISGQYLAPWLVSTNPPSIVRQPQAVTTQEFSQVVFNLGVTGGEPLTFQWQRDGVDIDAQTTPTLILERVLLEDDGAQFRCLVSNPFGSLTSQTVRLTVTPDSIPPKLWQVHPPSNIVVRALSQAQIWFDEPVQGVQPADLLVNGQPATNVLGAGPGPYIFEFAPLATGPVQFAWAANQAIIDLSLLSNAFAGGEWTVTLNPEAPAAQLAINEFVAANENGWLDEDGEYQSWIELYNGGTNSVDLAGWSLTDDAREPGRWVFPARVLAAGQYLVVFASGKGRATPTGTNLLHTNFKLASGGEYLGLFSPDSPRLPASEFAPEYPEQRNDISFGASGSNQWSYFLTPTPGTVNAGLTATGVVDAPHFNVTRGFFNSSFNLALVTTTPGAQIRYTTDGRTPTATTGYLYGNRIPISSSTLIRAAAFKTGMLSSKVITHSYFFGLSSGLMSLPVLSLVTDQNNLTGPTGIIGIGGGTYSNGVWQAVNPGDYNNCTNHGLEWERPVSAELMLPEDNSGFQVDCGIRIHGSPHIRPRYTVNSKFSYRLYFRGDYGAGKLRYPLFGPAAIQEFDQIVVRAGKNDTTNPFIKDEMMRRMAISLGQVHVRGFFANLFVNGAYKGYYNPTERVEEDFCQAWHGSTNDWDMITVASAAQDGDNLDWNAMRSFVSGNSMTTPANYQRATAWLDVTNFVDYLLVNIYGACRDWPHNNWRAGRERRPGALWRFYMWDAEGTFGGFSASVTEDTFSLLLNGGTAEIPRLYQSLALSPEFRLLFADRIQKHFFNNGALTDARVTTNFLMLKQELSGVIPNMQTVILDTWIPNRRPAILTHFPLYDLAAYTNSPRFLPQGGRVTAGQLVTMSASRGTIYYTTNGTDPRVPFSGEVASSARAYAGGVSIDRSLTLMARALEGTNWSARVEADYLAGQLGVPLRITEIMYDPVGSSAFEYLEIENTGGSTIDLSDFSMEGIEFRFPQSASIAPGQRIVLASDADPPLFMQRYPLAPVAGWFGGALRNEGERLAILDVNGNTVCSVTYKAGPGWPVTPDGMGHSLELIDPSGDPNSAVSWQASAGPNGSAGLSNPPPATPAILLNELMADNAGAVTNGTNFPDWIELHNPGLEPVSLAGWSLTDDSNPRKFVFPAETQLEAGGFLVVWCDQDTNAPGFHSGFALDPQGEAVWLYDDRTNRVDAVAFGQQLPNLTLGRGSDGKWRLNLPTPASANRMAATAPSSNLTINEWLPNPSPGEDDWIELYNQSTNLPLALNGIYLGTSNDLCRLRSHSFMPAGGFIQLLADKRPGPAHLDFKLPATGGAVILFDEIGQELSRVLYASMPENFSRGRWPDGSIYVAYFNASRSPGAPNYLTASNGIVLNEVMAKNTASITNRAGRFADWIELYNSNPTNVSLEGLSLGIDRAKAGDWSFPAGASIPAKGYLVVWCDPLEAASTNLVGDLNTGRGIEVESGAVYLFNATGQLADQVEFGFQIADLPIGRWNDAWKLLGTPTPGQPNATPATLASYSNLRINEWFAGSTNGNDWIELYNLAGQPVDLGDLFLTDDPSLAGRTRWQFAALSFVGGHGYVKIVADGEPDKGRDHAAFALDALGETLRLQTWTAQIIDSVESSPVDAGYSEARYPDGVGETIMPTSLPTPGAGNLLVHPLTIIAQPASQVTTNGYNAVFSVNVLGTGLLEYQWRIEGTNLIGATNSSLVLTNVDASHAGVYDVLVNDLENQLTSEPATLTVLYRPAIVSKPESLVVLEGSVVAWTMAASGTPPLGYRWRQNSRTVGYVFEDPTFVITNVQAAHAGYYNVVVTNAANRVGVLSGTAYLTVVTNRPQSQIVNPSDSVTFKVGATGPSPFGFQWRFDGDVLSGQTNDTLTIADIQVVNDGWYAVDVFTTNASLTVPAAALSVLRTPVLGKVWMDDQGNLLLDLDAPSGLTYVIEASTDVTHWEDYLTISHTNKNLPLALPSAPASPYGFYRLRMVLPE